MKQNKLISILSIFIFMFFLADVGLHFLIVPIDSLTFSVMNWKGDIDFVNIGAINILLRLLSLGGIVFFSSYRRPAYVIGLVLSLVTTVYLMVDSLWVFWNYLSLYGYWFWTLLLMIALFLAVWKPQWIRPYVKHLRIASWASMVIIALVYIDIMGFDWPYEFVYAYFQRIVFEGLYFVLGFYLLFQE
jgi:hypothetical protein